MSISALNPFAHMQGLALKAAITIICACGFILIGFDQGVMGGVIASTTFVAQFNNPSTNMQGLISSIYDIGCFCGALTMYFVSEPLGRRRPVLIGNILVILGTILQASSYSVAQLIVGRWVAGLGNGFNSGILPVYQSEMQGHKTRGLAITLETGTVIVGVALSNWICYAANFAETDVQWRLPIAIQAIFALICGSCIMLLPESPRWLVAHGDVPEAERVIARLNKKPIEDESVQQLKNEIVRADEYEKEIGEPSLTEIFSQGSGQNLRRVLLGCMPLMMQQMSGINAPSYYLPVLLQVNVGVSRNMSLILSSAAATQYAFFSFLPIFYIDRFGRRRTMITGSIGASLVLGLMAITISIATPAANIVTIILFFLFYDIFGMSYMVVSWLYASEINSLRFRSKGNALGLATHWICNFVIVMITPDGATNLGYRFYIIWAVINFSFIFLNWAFMVETKGKTLEEMDYLFERHQGWIVRSLEERGHKDLDIPSPLSRQEAGNSEKGVDAAIESRIEGL